MRAERFLQATGYGGILPTTWSLMLALRAHGLGAAWNTVHLKYAKEAAALLEIPDTITQVALLPVAGFLNASGSSRRHVARKEAPRRLDGS